MIAIHEIENGTGEAVKDGDKILLHYRGTFPDGKEFDSSYKRNQPFSFTVGAGSVIKGFDLGVLGMQKGGKRRIEIPSEFAYGKRGAGGAIPPDQDLVFELELVDIK
jgi:FKBP-type peptidyl-prolyl cis-trans isomerase